MNLPDKILLIGGNKRSGTSMMLQVMGSHSKIVFPTTEFHFLRWFGDREFGSNDNYKKNLEFFFSDCTKSSQWGLKPGMVSEDGTTARDLYCAIMDAYRTANKPDAQLWGDKSTLAEFEFDSYAELLGGERIKFIHMVRDPYDCFASYKYQNDTNKSSYNLLHHFCRDWSQSVVMGLSRSRKYPDSYKVIMFEEFLENPGEVCSDLCQWLGVPDERDSMLKLIDFNGIAARSSFEGEKTDDVSKGQIYKPSERRKYLTKHEIQTISSICAHNLLDLLGYESLGSGMTPARRLALVNSTYLYSVKLKDAVTAALYGAGNMLKDLVFRLFRGLSHDIRKKSSDGE